MALDLRLGTTVNCVINDEAHNEQNRIVPNRGKKGLYELISWLGSPQQIELQLRTASGLAARQQGQRVSKEQAKHQKCASDKQLLR